MLSIKKLLTKILVRLNDLTKVKELTTTFNANNGYINQTGFERLHLYRIGNLMVAYINLQFTTSLPSNNTWVEIGSFSGATPQYDVLAIIPGQTTQAHLMVSIGANGKIRLYNASGTATGVGFYRGQITLPLSGGGLLKRVISTLPGVFVRGWSCA